MKILNEERVLDPKIEKAVKQAIENNYFQDEPILKIGDFEFILDTDYDVFGASRIWLFVYENKKPLYELGFGIKVIMKTTNDIVQQGAIPYNVAVKRSS